MAGFLDILGPLIKVGGEVASKAASGRAEGRVAEGTATQAQDRNAVARYIAEQNAREAKLKLLEDATKDRADRTTTNAATRARQVGLGDVLAHMQEAKINLPSYIPNMKISGGLSPANLGPMTRTAGTNLAQQALAAQMSGSDIPDLPDVGSLGTAAPNLTALPQSGALDKILQVVGYAGQGIAGVDEARKQQQKAQAEQEAAKAKAGAPTMAQLGPQLPNAPASSAATGAGAIAPNQLAQLLELKRMQDAQDAANGVRAN